MNDEDEWLKAFNECYERSREAALLYVLCSFKRKMKPQSEYTLEQLKAIYSDLNPKPKKELWQGNGKRRKPRVK